MKLWSLILFVLLSACNDERRESEHCMALREQAYQAALADKLAEARSLLKQARQACGPASDYYIDRVERVLSRAERHESLADSRQRNSPSLLSGFVKWVGSLREAKNKALGEHHCAERGTELFGLCVSRVKVNDAVYQLEYALDDARVYRFFHTHAGASTCIDLGAHRDVSRWKTNDKLFEHCALTSHGLRGLHALIVRDGTHSTVSVYSPEYVDRLPAFRQQLER